MRDRAPPRLLRRMRTEHVGLEQCVRALSSELTHDESGELRDRAVVRTLEHLEALAGKLRDHFALEEKGGYLSDVLTAAPRLARQIENLERDHTLLLARVDALVMRARDGAGSVESWTETRMGLAAFLRALHAHESAENDLVFEAFLHDLSASD